MLGTSTIEWIGIRISILLLRNTPTLYLGGLLGLGLYHGRAAWNLTSTKVLLGLLGTEALYACFTYLPFQRRLRQAAVHPAPMTKSERHELFHKCLDHVPDLEEYLRGWFLGAESDQIRHENVREFLLWAFFELEDEDMASEVEDGASEDSISKQLDEYVEEIESRLGRQFEPGHGPAKSLRLTFDRIHATYRSLAWYMIVLGLDQVTHAILRGSGFQYHALPASSTFDTFPPSLHQLNARDRSPASDIGYWHKPHRSRDKIPLVFVHGIGPGLWAYRNFLRELSPAGDVGIIAIEVRPIMFRLSPPLMDRQQFLEQMTQIVDRHRWDRFNIVSHSYGSVLTTHMLRHQPLARRIPSAVLIDPVTILLHMPSVAYNFTRRLPSGANEWQLWYFASTDPGVALCLGRHFFWRENIIWKEELLGLADFANGDTQQDGSPAPSKPGTVRNVAVSLAGRDLIVDAAAVARYLTGTSAGATGQGQANRKAQSREAEEEEIKLIVFPHLDHAQVFDDERCRQRLVELTRSYCSK